MQEPVCQDCHQGLCQARGILFAKGFFSLESRNKSYRMKFTLEVGEVEKHRIEFNYNQLAGSLLIKVDMQPVCKSVRLLNEPVHEVYRFMVGQMVKTEVRIEKWRKQLFGYRNCVYVDDRLLQVFEGN